MNVALAALCVAFFAAVIVLAYLAVRDLLTNISCRIDDAFLASKCPWGNFWLHMLVMVDFLVMLAMGAMANAETAISLAMRIYEWR